MGVFIDRVHTLQKSRFHVLVSLLMTPRMVNHFPEISNVLEPHRLYIIPKVMRGVYKGVRYPAAYSAGEKSLILQYLGEARKQYRSAIESMGETVSIDMFSDDHFLDGIPDYRGKPCGSGCNFVRIDPDETVLRCGSGERLGTILLRNVTLLCAAKRCDTSYCPFFCEKYTPPRYLGTDTVAVEE